MSAEPAWWWLSFCDADLPVGSQFLGVAVVRGSDMVNAVLEAHRLGVNPGGQVLGIPIPAEHLPPEDHRERLLSRDEAEALP